MHDMIDGFPIIDIGPYLAGDAEARTGLADSLRFALEHVGFFVLINHDVPSSLIARTFGEAQRFHHELTMEEKMALRMNEHNNGYMAMSQYTIVTSGINDNDQPDLNEAFFIKRERSARDPLRLSGRRFVGENLWPPKLVDFKANVLEYTDTVDQLARRMLPALAQALDLTPTYFDAAFAQSQFSFRLSHYPRVNAQPNQFGIAPHTDANFMTFLAQTDVPGLEVRMPDGEWRPVPYLPNSFAVNSGDMLHRWTNGRLKSTPHRALPPTKQARYAIPFFLGPHIDTVIECLPTCQSPDHPARFDPITYDAYLHWWYDTNYNAAAQDDLNMAASGDD